MQADAGSLDVRGDGHGANGGSSQVDVAWPQLGSTRVQPVFAFPETSEIPSDFQTSGSRVLDPGSSIARFKKVCSCAQSLPISEPASISAF